MKKKTLALLLALCLALSLAACGGNAGETTNANVDGSTDSGEATEPPAQVDVDLTAFYESVVEGDEWPALMALEGELLDSFYPGLSELSLKQCLVYTAAISATVGEIALVEAETAEDARKAADIFQARIDYQVGDDETPGGAWYPATIEGWKTTSRIKGEGNYVCMAVGDCSDAAVESFEALFS